MKDLENEISHEIFIFVVLLDIENDQFRIDKYLHIPLYEP
jgi:hypothetical protein